MDVIEYTDLKQIPTLLMLDKEKAFDSVNHNFLLNVLEHFNLGDKFTQRVKMMYLDRNSYVIKNWFLTKSISLKKGIFQGCPISPYLFLLVMETMTLAIRQNVNIKGIPIDDIEF